MLIIIVANRHTTISIYEHIIDPCPARPVYTGVYGFKYILDQ